MNAVLAAAPNPSCLLTSIRLASPAALWVGSGRSTDKPRLAGGPAIVRRQQHAPVGRGVKDVRLFRHGGGRDQQERRPGHALPGGLDFLRPDRVAAREVDPEGRVRDPCIDRGRAVRRGLTVDLPGRGGRVALRGRVALVDLHLGTAAANPEVLVVERPGDGLDGRGDVIAGRDVDHDRGVGAGCAGDDCPGGHGDHAHSRDRHGDSHQLRGADPAGPPAPSGARTCCPC